MRQLTGELTSLVLEGGGGWAPIIKQLQVTEMAYLSRLQTFIQKINYIPKPRLQFQVTEMV